MSGRVSVGGLAEAGVGVPRPEASARLAAPAHAALAAALLTAVGSSLGDHLQFLLAIPLTCAGFALTCQAVRFVGQPAPSRTYSWIEIGLGATVGVAAIVGPPSHTALWYQALYWGYCAAAIVLAAAIASGSEAARRRAVWAAVIAATAVHVVLPIAAERPTIDVWTWTDACVRALLHGAHPYTAHAIDPNRGGYDYGYVTTVYPYMPLVVMANAPATALLGDYRFGLACCLPLTIALVRAAGRKLKVDGRLLDTATLALLLHPQSVYMVSLGWTEPLLVVALALFVWVSADGRHPFGEAFALLLMPCLKQYVVAPVLMYLTELRRWRAAAIGALALFAVTIAPFLIGNWRATLDGMLFPLRGSMAFRPDSDSMAAVVYRFGGTVPPRWLAPVVQIAVGAVAYARLRREGLAGLLLASAVALFASFLVGTQAFVNYYYFVTALLVCAAVALGRGAVAA